MTDDPLDIPPFLLRGHPDCLARVAAPPTISAARTDVPAVVAPRYRTPAAKRVVEAHVLGILGAGTHGRRWINAHNPDREQFPDKAVRAAILRMCRAPRLERIGRKYRRIGR